MTVPGSTAGRYGLSLPLEGLAPGDLRPAVEEAQALGYTDLWSSEVDGTDAFTPLAAAATWAPGLRLGTAIASVFTRGPALLAMSAAALAHAAPGRFTLGIGASSAAIVADWNGLPFTQPYQRVRDTIAFLRDVLAGERVDHTYETFAVKGFRLGTPPAVVPDILVAALRPGMLRLAGTAGDGVILNWLAPDDVPRVLAHVGAGTAPPEVVARLFVVTGSDRAAVRAHARRMVAGYLNVPTYAAYQAWLGREDLLGEMWRRWGQGDRRGALAAVPDEVLDQLFVMGTPDECRARVDDYVRAGVTTPVLAIVDLDGDPRARVRDLAPSRALPPEDLPS